jgi:hypothetical protein
VTIDKVLEVGAEALRVHAAGKPVIVQNMSRLDYIPGTSECTRRHKAARFTFFGNIPRQYVGTERESESEKRCMWIQLRDIKDRLSKVVRVAESVELRTCQGHSSASSEVDNHSAISKAAFLHWCHRRSDNVANICFMRAACETMQNNDNGGCFVIDASGGSWWCEINPKSCAIFESEELPVIHHWICLRKIADDSISGLQVAIEKPPGSLEGCKYAWTPSLD